MSVLHFSWGLSALLKMAYINPRPFYSHQDITAYICKAGWGNPSDNAIIFTSFVLTFWKVIFEHPILKEYKKVRICCLGFGILILLTTYMTSILTGNNSINQILFGACIGFSIYFFVFYIMGVDLYDSKQFIRFIKAKYLWNILLYLVILIAGILLYYCRKLDNDLQNLFEVRISIDCPGTPEIQRLHKEALIELIYSCTFIAAIIALKVEFKMFTSNSNDDKLEKKWRDNNFDSAINEDEEQFDSRKSIFINTTTQWNHTNTVFTVVRIFVSCILTFVIYLPSIFIKYDSNIVLVIIMKILLPMILFYISLFYLFKALFRVFKLGNFSANLLIAIQEPLRTEN